MNILDDLSTELLIQIFQYCDIKDLCRLKQTCQRLNKIIDNFLHCILRRDILVTNQLKPFIKARCNVDLDINDKWKVSHHWKIGKYNEKSFLYERENYIPWLNLTDKHVWLSRGPYIKAYKRRNGKVDVQNPLYVLSGSNLSDVSKFVKTDDCIISGQCDGSVWIWMETDNRIIGSHTNHTSAVNSVDIYKNLFVTGSRDCFFKVWLCKNDFSSFESIYSYFLNDRIWSTSFNIDGTRLAIGTSGCNAVPPLHIFDVNSFTKSQVFGEGFKNGSGILDMKWESNNILLTCGYDTLVRKWDLRTGMYVQAWEDPFQATVYCLDSDNVCTLFTGTQSHGRVVLFDTRHAKYVQIYFMQSCRKRGRSSPIYSLAFDSTQLFTATDQHLNLLDFSDDEAKVRNYSNLYYKVLLCK